MALTRFSENSNMVCEGQRFSTVEEAFAAMESKEREINDTDLDYCPPYVVKYYFDCEDNVVVLYSYCVSFDGTESSNEYAVRILKKNSDGTLSFDSGFSDFKLEEPSESEDYYYFTDIEIKKETKSISILYLDKNSSKEIYVDGIQTKKELVKIDDREFYLCYAISNRDTFFSNLITPISERHSIKIK